MKLRVYNKTLDPSLWNENKTLKPEVREHLLKIAEDFYNSTDLTGDVHNILFIGSSANYNWTPTSDIDLHIVIDIAEEKINEEYARKFMDSLGFKWNTEHDIEIKGHPVEVYIQDIREPNADATKGRPGAAIYSLYDGKWLIEPKHEPPQIDADKVRQKYQVIQRKIKNLVNTSDITKLKELMKSIRNYRNAGLASGGEFSVENLVFKALRKGGDLQKIKDTINTVYDKYASLPENGNIQPDKKTTPMKEGIKRKDLQSWLTKQQKSQENPNGNFLIIGAVRDDDLEVYSLKTYEKGYNHKDIPNFDLHDKRWRYKSKTNTIYWMTTPSEMMKDAVEVHLEKKYGIKNPKQSINFDDYFNVGHVISELIDKTKPFLIVGGIKLTGYVYSQIDYKDGLIGHSNIPEYSGGRDKRWRYGSKTNTVYWIHGEKPTTEEMHSVENHLDKKYSIVNPNQEISLYGYFKFGHSLTETKNLKAFTLVGVINDDLDVNSLIDYNDEYSHGLDIPLRPHDTRWRYNSKRNTVYWPDSESPTPQQQDAVEIHLDEKYGIINPKQLIDFDSYSTHGHYIDENIVDKKANLYLGFVNRENFKVVGINVEDDNNDEGYYTHDDFQRNLPKEYQWYYGTEALLWRYKRSNNTVYWWSAYSSPNDEEKQAVEDWLFKNANIKYPEHKMISWDKDTKSVRRRLAAHSTTADFDDEEDSY